MPTRDLDVVLYGATGYTGRLIAHELAEQGASFALAGRSQARLAELADELEADPAIIEASIEDEGALQTMAARARVVASAAGPFKHLGPPVMRAALSTGAHFVDITGEQSYLRWAWDQHERAREAGLTVVNAMGFDVIPSDIAALRACQGLDDVVRLDLAIASQARLSGGTKRSMAASTGEGWWYEAGAYHAGPPGRFVRSFEFPIDGVPGTGAFIPWGDCVTAPRSTGARVVRTFFTMPEDRARKMHLLWPVVSLIGRIPFVARLAESRAPGSREGPDAETRAEARFTIMGDAHGSDGERQRSLVTGRDPYGLTGAAAARGALALANGEVEDHGVLTPTQAFSVERLEKMLPEFELESRLVGRS